MKSLQSKAMVSALLIALTVSPLYATNITSNTPISLQPYLSLSSGISLASIKGSNAKKIISSGATNSYSFNGKSNANDIFYAVEAGVHIHTQSSYWFSAVDLSTSYSNAGTLTPSGKHNINAPPVINNANYHYKYHLGLSAFSLMQTPICIAGKKTLY